MVLGSREHGAEEKHFRELGRKVIFLSGSREQRPPWAGLVTAQRICTFDFVYAECLFSDVAAQFSFLLQMPIYDQSIPFFKFNFILLLIVSKFSNQIAATMKINFRSSQY